MLFNPFFLAKKKSIDLNHQLNQLLQLNRDRKFSKGMIHHVKHVPDLLNLGFIRFLKG